VSVPHVLEKAPNDRFVLFRCHESPLFDVQRIGFYPSCVRA
jgi:hypothetical protein